MQRQRDEVGKANNLAPGLEGRKYEVEGCTESWSPLLCLLLFLHVTAGNDSHGYDGLQEKSRPQNHPVPSIAQPGQEGEIHVNGRMEEDKPPNVTVESSLDDAQKQLGVARAPQVRTLLPPSRPTPPSPTVEYFLSGGRPTIDQQATELR